MNVWSLAWAGLLLGIGWASGACLPMGEGQVFLMGGDVVLTELLPLHSGRDCSKVRLGGAFVVPFAPVAMFVTLIISLLVLLLLFSVLFSFISNSNSSIIVIVTIIIACNYDSSMYC